MAKRAAVLAGRRCYVAGSAQLVEGKTNPRPEARAALAKVLGVTEAALIGIETMKPADDSQAIEAVNVSVHLSDGRPVEIRGLPLKLDQRDHDRLTKALAAYVSN